MSIDKDSPEYQALREELLAEVRADLERERGAANPLAPVRRAKGMATSKVQRYDARTGVMEYDHQAAEMWTRQIHEKNGIEYGVTISVHGLKSIKKAMRPTVDTDGMPVREGFIPADEATAKALAEAFGWRNPDGSLRVPPYMPKELQVTPEKRALLDSESKKPALPEDWKRQKMERAIGTELKVVNDGA